MGEVKKVTAEERRQFREVEQADIPTALTICRAIRDDDRASAADRLEAIRVLFAVKEVREKR